MNKPSFGVIVGRFQVHELHDGHMELFRIVKSRHNRIIILLGCNKVGPTRHDPLDFKNPKTDPSKASIGGRFALLDMHDGEFATVPFEYDKRNAPGTTDLLETVFEDGKVLCHQTLDEIRELSNQYDRYSVLEEVSA